MRARAASLCSRSGEQRKVHDVLVVRVSGDRGRHVNSSFFLLRCHKNRPGLFQRNPHFYRKANGEGTNLNNLLKINILILGRHFYVCYLKKKTGICLYDPFVLTTIFKLPVMHFNVVACCDPFNLFDIMSNFILR